MDKPSPEFSVVIPAYNEIEAITPVLERVVGCLDALQRPYEVVVVDDGSSDGTDQRVRDLGHDRVRLEQHPYNMGNGAAIKTGMRRSRGKIIVFMDCDGQHDPADIERMVAGCERFDMVVGARGSESQAGWHRWLANSFFNFLASYVTGRQVLDLTSGFRAMRRQVARQFISLLPNTFSYPTTITLAFMRAGYSVEYMPIAAGTRKGQSKIRPLKDGTMFLLIIMKICMLFSPLKIFLPVSVYLFLMGIGYYGWTFWTAHRFTNMSMLLFSTSVIIFMMGLVAEQIAQMRSERGERGD